MRFTLMLFALLVMAAGPAQANGERITVSDIHNFVQRASNAFNDSNRYMARDFLRRVMAEDATFVNHTATYEPSHWQLARYYDPAYGSYYRYPLNPYYRPTGVSRNGKWDQINALDYKKQKIPGYVVKLEIADTYIQPYGRAAAVDLNMKEYTLSYSPNQPNLARQTMYANSKCKMYLSRDKINHELLLTGMECNTNTNMPF